jgi:7-cyano-7-deazaguanine synthase
VLISKAAVLCTRLGERRLAMGTLSNNPFPDATSEFFGAISHAMSLGLGLTQPFSVVTPLVKYHKEDVVQLGATLGVPFELTMSCMNPAGDRHCGQCSKCRERIDAFRVAGVADPTDYASVWQSSKFEV